jgi:signal transduction histidine kinase/CheY-like chemotaxis protein
MRPGLDPQLTSGATTVRKGTSALFASNQFIFGRLMSSGLIALVAMMLGARLWPVAWLAALAICITCQGSLNKQWKNRGSDPSTRLMRSRTLLSLIDTTLYALAAILINQTPSILAASFSLMLIMVTMLYVLMHFFSQPKLMLIIITPCALSLLYCEGIAAVGEANTGHPVAACVPIIGAFVVIFFFSEARRQLARARTLLIDARLAAVEREGEARAGSLAKSEFLATMGHEIRTPLNGVLGIAQVMSKDALSDRQRDRLNIIQGSGESLLSILNDLLDFSKIEAGKLEFEHREFGLRHAVGAVVATFTAAAAAKSVKFGLIMEAAAEGLYLGDEIRLRQVLYNLISNAVKFTERGEVMVTISYRDGNIGFSVRDTGIGIPPDRVSTLFDKFIQADSSTTRRYGGTGLGLAIVQQLVHLMGGTLDVQSEVGQGSTFTASLPLQRLGPEVADSAAVPPVTPEIEALRPAGALSILAAEDNAVNQIVLKAMLEQIGVQPYLVADGLAAVDAWESQEWDLILMDVQMPNMDGPSATQIIRQRELDLGRRRTPIIALTANAMDHQRQAYMACGMDLLVSKPIGAALLFEAIETALALEEFDAADALTPIN